MRESRDVPAQNITDEIKINVKLYKLKSLCFAAPLDQNLRWVIAADLRAGFV